MGRQCAATRKRFGRRSGGYTRIQTSLTSLSVKPKRPFARKGVVLCRLKRSPGILAEIGLSKQNIDDIIEEASWICDTGEAGD